MAGRARFGARDLVRVWSSAPGAQRMRRPTDVLLVTASVLLLDSQGRFRGTIAYREDAASAVEKIRKLIREDGA